MKRISLTLCLALALGAVSGTSRTAQSATITVDNLNDILTGCDLRQAIVSLNTPGNTGGCVATGDAYGTNDTIQFDDTLTGSVVLQSALPPIQRSVTIPAPALPITIDGDGQFRVLEIDSISNDQFVSITGLTLANGLATGGAGLFVHTGDTVNLDAVNILNNDAQGPGTNFGGGILNRGILNVNNSTIAGNSSDNYGGGVFNSNIGGQGITSISNSTISGNRAFNDNGGGIGTLGGSLTVTNATISGNTGEDGGGLSASFSSIVLNNVTIAGNHAEDVGGGINNTVGAEINISNSILADNTADNDGNDCFGNVESQDHNLIEDAVDCNITGTTTNNITNQDPLLGALQNNGGPTKTLALLPGSPALEAGNPATPDGVAPNCATSDQRGIDRPRVVFCDMGAFESTGSADLLITKTVDKARADVGEVVTFTVTVSNLSATTQADGISVDDIVNGPLNVTGLNPNGFTCTNVTGDAQAGPVVNQCGLASLAAGATASFTVVGEITGEGIVTNLASGASTGTVDPVPTNNTAVASVNGEAQADLSLTKVASVSSGDIDDVVTFKITVANSADSQPATAVRVTDNLSGNGNFNVTSVSPGCTGTGSNPLVILCDLGTLNPGENKVLEITGVITDSGVIQNTAAVADLGGTDDPNLSNNFGSATVDTFPVSVNGGCSLQSAATSSSFGGMMLLGSLGFLVFFRFRRNG